MSEDITNIPLKPYINPVYPKSFPDPFVLKFRGVYYAYCTDFWHDGNVFGVLRSRDLVNWEEIGGAMPPLETGPPFYWAPEVTYAGGKFYLYYSAGNEALMEIRVAVSDTPDGGFIDSGKRLTREDFAIDAHVFTDEDGKRYLFYATDFLGHTHIGTGTVVDRMIDFYTLEGNPRPVTRAKYDWQVYDANRREKGGVRWHTVEGAFVLKRKGKYFEMFSGGNWQNITYGVSFATTDDIERNEEWEQFSDGEKIMPILRTLPGVVTGPGHNSVIRGPNNRELFCIYHRWTENGRALAIDWMDFAGRGRMFVRGATTAPQTAPFKPSILDFFDNFADKNWKIVSGHWFTEANQMISDISETGELGCRFEGESFLFEISWRLIENAAGRFGICLKRDKTNVFQFLLEPGENKVRTGWLEHEQLKTEFFKLPDDFDFQAFHLMRVETNYQTVKILLDEQLVCFRNNLEQIPIQISLAAENCRAAFSGAALTGGFEDLFEKDDLERQGWQKITVGGDHRIEHQNLIITARSIDKTVIEKEISFENYELTFNFCLIETFGDNFKFGLRLASDEKNPFISFVQTGPGWFLQIETPEAIKQFPLAESFSPDAFHQFSFLKIGDRLILKSETETIDTINIPQKSSKISFSAENLSVAFDMIRVTAL